VPDAVDGLDGRTVAALRSGENEWTALLARQNAAIDRAGVYGAWSNAATVAIAFVVALFALAQAIPVVTRRRAREPVQLEDPPGRHDDGAATPTDLLPEPERQHGNAGEDPPSQG
jgi:hypothetical protein